MSIYIISLTFAIIELILLVLIIIDIRRDKRLINRAATLLSFQADKSAFTGSAWSESAKQWLAEFNGEKPKPKYQYNPHP